MNQVSTTCLFLLFDFCVPVCVTISGENFLDNSASPVIVSPNNSDLDIGPLTDEQLIDESPVSSDFDFSDEVRLLQYRHTCT